MFWRQLAMILVGSMCFFAFLSLDPKPPPTTQTKFSYGRRPKEFQTKFNYDRRSGQGLEPRTMQNDTSTLEGKEDLELRTMQDDTSTSEGKEDSFGFFRDIPNKRWRLLRNLHDKKLKRQRSFHGHSSQSSPRAWWQENWEPNFPCLLEERLGNVGSGGKWVCDPSRIQEKIAEGGGCIVYSIGSNNEFDFEEAIYREISDQCEIHTFDPTLGGNPSNKPQYVHFHPWGLGSVGVHSIRGSSPLARHMSLAEIRSKLGHMDKEIDIFKIDCEGCERWAARQIFTTTTTNVVPIRQVMMEVHRAEGELFEVATKAGFAIYHKEPNIEFPMGSSYAVEYGFVKLNI